MKFVCYITVNIIIIKVLLMSLLNLFFLIVLESGAPLSSFFEEVLHICKSLNALIINH